MGNQVATDNLGQAQQSQTGEQNSSSGKKSRIVDTLRTKFTKMIHGSNDDEDDRKHAQHVSGKQVELEEEADNLSISPKLKKKLSLDKDLLGVKMVSQIESPKPKKPELVSEKWLLHDKLCKLLDLSVDAQESHCFIDLSSLHEQLEKDEFGNLCLTPLVFNDTVCYDILSSRHQEYFPDEIEKISYLIKKINSLYYAKETRFSELYESLINYLLSFSNDNSVYLQEKPLEQDQILKKILEEIQKLSLEVQTVIIRRGFQTQKEEIVKLLTNLINLLVRSVDASCILEAKNFDLPVKFLDTMFDIQEFKDWYLLESTLFYNPQLTRALNIQNQTLIPKLLSISCILSEGNFQNSLLHSKIELTQENRKNLEVHKTFSFVLEFVTKKMLQFLEEDVYQRRILDWLEQIIKLNNNRNKMNFVQFQCCNDGFQVNFLILLLNLYFGRVRQQNNRQVFENINFKRLLDSFPLYENEVRIISQDNMVQSRLHQLTEEGNLQYDEALTQIFAYTSQQLKIAFPIYQQFLVELAQLQQLQQQQVQQIETLRKKVFGIVKCWEVQLLRSPLKEMLEKFLGQQSEFQVWLNGSSSYQEMYEQGLGSGHYGFQPVFIIENLMNWYLTMRRCFQLHLLSSSEGAKMLSLCIVWIGSRQLCPNPYLRQRISNFPISFCSHEQLHHQNQGSGGHGSLEQIIKLQNGFVERYLLRSLFSIYIDSKKIPVSSANQDGYIYLSQIVRYVRVLTDNSSAFKKSLTNLFYEQRELMIQFSKSLVQDLIDLQEFINITFQKMVETNAFLQKHPQSAVREKQLKQKQHLVRMIQKKIQPSFDKYWENFELLTDRELVLVDEVRDKVVRNLNYMFYSLVEKCSSLEKMKAYEEFGFSFRTELNAIANFYLRFSDCEEFKLAMIKDERYFKLQDFEKFLQLIEKSGYLEESTLKKFQQFLRRASVIKDEGELLTKQLMENIPEEFLDPILFEIMRDPVLLPNSEMVVDRSTIKQHLMEDHSDPFNRTPLTIDQVIEQPELKKRIEDYTMQAKLEIQAKKAKQEEEVQERLRLRQLFYQDQTTNQPPQEFLDALTKSLMSDPVLLPGSGKIVDIQTIKDHLISSNTDPFDKSPLKIEQVIEQVEMKAKIQQFKETQLKNSQQNQNSNTAIEEEEEKKIDEI